MLEVKNLTKRYGRDTVLYPVSFSVSPGSVLGLVGPNGAGKTTTLSCLAGLIRPDGGTATWQGRPILSQPGVVSLLPESPEVYSLLTVYEHLELTARLFQLDASWREEAERILDTMDLSPHRGKLGATLSKGLRQRVLMACTAIRHAPLLFVDEPMIGLDPAGQREVKNMLAAFREQGAAVVLSSHQLDIIEELADEVLILAKGRVMAHGSIAALKEQSGTDTALEEWFFHYTDSSK